MQQHHDVIQRIRFSFWGDLTSDDTMNKSPNEVCVLWKQQPDVWENLSFFVHVCILIIIIHGYSIALGNVVMVI